jgi:hypothetical protein
MPAELSEARKDQPKPISDKQKTQESLLRLLSFFEYGSVTITVNNFPFAKIDIASKLLDVELRGILESGLKLGELFDSNALGGNVVDAIKRSGDFAKNLNRNGWSIRVYEGESSILKLGRGLSPLTGYVWLNPLKLSKLLRVI